MWEWYDWRRQLIAACEPNRAHAVIADWSRRYPDCRLITQNVDGLHERAGAGGCDSVPRLPVGGRLLARLRRFASPMDGPNRPVRPIATTLPAL